jgi:hypothetical protein
LSVCIRPDIAQAVGVPARYMSAPTEAHRTVALGVVRYLAVTATCGLTYGSGLPELRAYGDADYASDLDSHRSMTGYVFVMHEGAVSWSSRLQPTVAISTVECRVHGGGNGCEGGALIHEAGKRHRSQERIVQILCDN